MVSVMGDSLDNRMNIDSSFTIHSTGRRRKDVPIPTLSERN